MLDFFIMVLSRYTIFRKRYQKGHWDQVISDYREIELDLDNIFLQNVPSETNLCRGVIERIRRHLEMVHFATAPDEKRMDKTKAIEWLPCHAIDLRKDGVLSPHVDSVRFSGDIVAGLSLKSCSIMRLKPQNQEKAEWVDLFLPPSSLYVLSGVSRYLYTHELLPSGAVFHVGEKEIIPVERQDRISIIFRDALQQQNYNYPTVSN
jgi:alkylated DNA repair protein alkB family protein 7